MLGKPSRLSRSSSPNVAVLPTFVGASLPKARSPARFIWVLGLLFFGCLSQLPLPDVRPTRWRGELWQWHGTACRNPDRLGVGSFNPRSLAVRVRAVDPTVQDGEAHARDGVVLNEVFHPRLAALRSHLFGRGWRIPTGASSDPEDEHGCIHPASHVVEYIVPTAKYAPDPTLFHAMCTTPDRVVASAPIWSHFVSANPREGSPSGCLVVDATGSQDSAALARVNDALRKAGTTCGFADSSLSREARYEHRVLALVNDAWVAAERRRTEDGGPLVQWFLIGDDDTWWVDQTLLKERLTSLDYREDHFLGAYSETEHNLEMFGYIAYGGAGIIISRGLMEKMRQNLDVCFKKFGDLFGGDAMLTNCAAMIRNLPLEEVLEQVPGLSQMDMKGDATGFLSAGRGPFLTLHHWAGWLELMPGPGRVQTDIVALFRQTVDRIGGRNFLRRWSFDGGAVMWTVGYSVVVLKDALPAEELAKAERTWDEHFPTRPSRPPQRESVDKLTYYLSSVTVISPTITRFTHTCTSPTLSKGGLSEIEVFWERSEGGEWWTLDGEGAAKGRLDANASNGMDEEEEEEESKFLLSQKRKKEGLRAG